ncbi:hypothetical protein BC830DRAFT_350848 [Chytriomyces sp. MP71]|nr:hypothetical protein BC830DRAFT_350848 [Chytriomyces sp. MP71]
MISKVGRCDDACVRLLCDRAYLNQAKVAQKSFPRIMADDYGLEQHAAKRTYTLSSATGGMYSGAGDSGSEAGGSGVTTPPGTKPKGRAGRKFITEPAPTKRAGQNRDAQRAYRERKEAYVRKLETEVAELRQRLGEGDGEAAATGAVLIANPVQAHSMPHSATALASSLTAGDCPSCAAERIKNADLVARNHLLEQELHQLRQEANNKSATPPATFSQELFNQEFALFAAQSMDATSNNSVSSAMALDLDSLSLQNQMYLKQDPFDSLFGPAFLSLQPTLSSPQPDGGFSHLTPVTRFFGSGGGSGGSRESSAAPYAVNPSPSTSASMDDWIDEVKPKISESRRGSSFNAGKTAVELYGPFMLEDTREKLKALPSLKNSKHVDDVLDAFVVCFSFFLFQFVM